MNYQFLVIKRRVVRLLGNAFLALSSVPVVFDRYNNGHAIKFENIHEYYLDGSVDVAHIALVWEEGEIRRYIR